jgi:uncharacterized protein (TIGR02246 family)
MTWLQVCGLCATFPTGVFGAILLGACVGGTALDEERAIRELDAAWSQALSARDLDAVMSYYADDAAFLAPNAPIVRGKAAIRARFAGRLALPGYSASFAPTAITVARSGDIAYEIGAYRLVIDDGAGQSRTTTGKHLVTWEKRDGAWRVTAESINPDHPPA